MIRVDRNRPDSRSKDRLPIQPSANWFESAEQATRKAEAEGEAHQVTDLYRHREVRIALEELFYDKCAYCESRPTATSSWDVEHYRPKGRVAERPDHPGYYWLAYTWSNLYLSCSHCNQRRRDAPRWGDPTPLPAGGKADQFPLENETDRALSPEDDLTRECPLLLDPCDPHDDPEAHLTYDSQGQILARRPEDQRATETIRILHLNRRRLRKDRMRIFAQVAKVLRLLGSKTVERNAELADDVSRVLEDLLADDALHAGVARAVASDPRAV